MTRKTQTLQLVQDATMERIAVSAVSKVGVLVPPWALLGVEAAAGAVSHALWGGPGSLAWAAVGCTLGSTALTGLTWLVTHHRRMVGRVHATATTAAASGWFTVATITGVGAGATWGALFFGGGALALSWNIRTVIRNVGGDQEHGGDALGNLFDRAKEQAGLKQVRVRATEVTDHRVAGKMALPPGQMTGDDAVKASDRIESAMQLPPGSVKVTHDRNRADMANISVSDPRVIESPVPWPGPSLPGGSIAKPLRIGLYQDGDYVLYTLPGTRVQIMGASGSGKSFGGGWGIAGEAITRRDAAVFAIDTSKDDQTMGPLRAALHRFETTPAGAVALIRDMHAQIPERTKWLAEHGYSDWEEGCGLTYWILIIEEVAKLIASLSSDDEEKLIEIMKEMRSAGGALILSLQRADYTQIPTILRSQMAKFCFGLNDPDDVKYGVSARQRKADVTPHEWETNYPGMAYLDGPSIRATHYAMPLRTWAYGATSGEARAVMAAHAAAFPASERIGDKFTAAITKLPAPAPAAPASVPAELETPQDPAEAAHSEYVAEVAELLGDAAHLVIATQHASPQMLQRKLRVARQDCLRLLEALERKGIVGPPAPGGESRPVLVAADDRGAAELVARLREHGDPVTAALRTEDPDPSVTASYADTIQEPTDAEGEALQAPQEQPTLSPEAARGVVYAWLRARYSDGRPCFVASDEELTAIRAKVGNGRTWVYKVLKDLIARHVLSAAKDGSTTTYTIKDLSPLDREGYGRAA